MPSPADLDLEVTIESSLPLPDTVDERAIHSLAAHILVAEGEKGWWQLGIQFVDDPEMQAAHAGFMGIDTPTDIITFPYDDDGFGNATNMVLPARGGDLMISVDRAAEHAADAGWSTAEELLFLVAHGILHILGWDDATEEDRARMLDRQSAHLRSWQQGRSGAS